MRLHAKFSHPPRDRNRRGVFGQKIYFMECNICGTELTKSSCRHYEKAKPKQEEKNPLVIAKRVQFLDNKLTVSQQRIILEELTDLRIKRGCKIGIVLDEEGDDFFGFEKNSGYDFTTIRGIVKYISQKNYSSGVQFGKSNIQRKLKSILDL